MKLYFVSGKSMSSLIFVVSLLSGVGCGGGGGGGRTPDNNSTLNVAIVGSGVVTSSPAGINCGNDCTNDYPNSSQVSLSSVADEGFVFDRWEGACTGSSSCSVNMSSDRSVRATFIEESTTQFELSITISGNGRVTSSPDGIDCESDCTESYSSNSVVSLTALPDSGMVLDHWQGACNGNQNCSVAMNQAREVSAIFAVEGQQSILISNYTAQNDAFQLGEIPNNASGITWHHGLQQYLVVRNNAATIYRYDENFSYVGEFQVNNISADTEGLAYVGQDDVMIVSENNIASKILVDEFTNGVNGSVPQSQQYRILSPGGSNKGIEGIAVRKATSTTPARVFACQEGTGGTNMRFAYFDIPEDSNSLYDFESNLTVVEPFDADQTFEQIVNDLAGMVYDDRTGHVIIVSQESSRAIQVEPETGSVISTLVLSGAPQYEGVTFGPNGELVFVSEGNWIRIYTSN
ncbi:MAG: SdiA-regulated domain-containing protein [Kangiellaceae bacterium]|nr:SdiA-regulated domain-containing protein [Kangiellaceae bacterium]